MSVILTCFSFETKTETDVSSLLARHSHNLKRLQFFTYAFHCTDEVVEQLGLHCTDLKKIHLSKLKKLNYINISNTGISCKSYQLLLSELQNVVNITALSPFHDALGNSLLQPKISLG